MKHWLLEKKGQCYSFINVLRKMYLTKIKKNKITICIFKYLYRVKNTVEKDGLNETGYSGCFRSDQWIDDIISEWESKAWYDEFLKQTLDSQPENLSLASLDLLEQNV